MNVLEEKLLIYKNKLKRVNEQLKSLNDEKNKILDEIEFLNSKIQVEKSKELGNKDWSTPDFPWSTKVLDALTNVFKLPEFRPLQLSTINSIMSGHDVILIMPTGGGKSLCYQLPAVISDGLTLVISPLISLMEDQISALRKMNIPCQLLSSSSSKEENNAALKEMVTKGSKLKLLYVTPERLAQSKRFMSNLQKCYNQKMLDRIAIDEVHCCSQWGHDFRPDYKYLNILKSTFPGVPIMGLTATATFKVTVDVQKMLKLEGCLLLKASFNRPNLFYQVLEKPAKSEDCMDLIAKLLKVRYANQSGIIYTTTVKDTEVIRDELKKRGLNVGCYHANMDPKHRSKTYEKWMDNTYQAVVATIAFGLGIDKPDVRFVIHHALSKSMENFYQESGRAGRDGKRSECVLLFKLSDIFKLSPMVFSSNTGIPNLYGMLEYCVDTQRCRRTIIADHFEEMWESSHCIKMCDYCIRPNQISRTYNLLQYFPAIKRILNSFSEPMTALMLVDSWLHKGAVKFRLKDEKPPNLSREQAECIIAWMLIKGLLTEDFHFTPYNTISYIHTVPDSKLPKVENNELLVPFTMWSKFDSNVPPPSSMENISNSIVEIKCDPNLLCELRQSSQDTSESKSSNKLSSNKSSSNKSSSNKKTANNKKRNATSSSKHQTKKMKTSVVKHETEDTIKSEQSDQSIIEIDD